MRGENKIQRAKRKEKTREVKKQQKEKSSVPRLQDNFKNVLLPHIQKKEAKKGSNAPG